MPDVVLDIVVRGNSVRTETASRQEKVPETPPMSIQEQAAKTDNSTTSAIRRNLYGLENTPMENYTHIDRPSTVSPSARALQSLSITITFTSDDTLQPQPVSINPPSRAPQETSATANPDDLTQIMFSAGQGDPKAQVSLGDMYKDGRKVQQDYQAAMDWYSKAAGQGNSAGQRKIGYIYTIGLGVSKDYVKAMEWYHKAADQGNALGNGVPQDYSQAMEWFTKAANQGYAGAQNNTGVLYHNGEGVPKDIYNAIEWFIKAARQCDTKAKDRLDKLKQQGHTID